MISTLVALAIGEIVARRAMGRQPLEAVRSADASPTSVTGYFWIRDDELGFANRADGDFVNTNVLEQPEVRTDALGHRRGLGPTQGAPVVLVAGDSIVFSAEVADDETPSSEIWRLLARRDAVEVRNIGVRGYNTVQARRAIERELDRTPDVRLVVLFLCSNDLVENVNPVIYFPAMAPTGRRDPQSGRIAEVEVGEFGSAWEKSGSWFAERDRLQALPPAIRRRIVDGLRRHSALANFTFQLLSPPPEGSVVDHVVLPDGWIGPVWSGDERWPEQSALAERSGAWDVLGHEVAAIDALVRRHGARLIVTESTYGGSRAARPTPYERVVIENGATFVSLEDAFPDRPVESYMTATATGFDPHYGPKGAKAVARALVPTIDCVVGGPCSRE